VTSCRMASSASTLSWSRITARLASSSSLTSTRRMDPSLPVRLVTRLVMVSLGLVGSIPPHTLSWSARPTSWSASAHTLTCWMGPAVNTVRWLGACPWAVLVKLGFVPTVRG
jgi:hypothetical protein